MNKKQERQDKIISFIEEKTEVSISDILSFLSIDVDRKTLQRDLKELEKKLLVFKKGLGKNTVYSLAQHYEILKEIDVKSYFEIPKVLEKQNIHALFDEGNRLQDWDKLEKLLAEQNNEHHFWK